MTVHGTIVAECHRLLSILTLSVLATDYIYVPCSGSLRHQDMERPPFAGDGDGL